MDKNIILLSGENDVYIKNNQTHFQNQLFEHNYLDPETSYSITPKLISIDLQFVNPACAIDPDYPAFITSPISRISKIWKSLNTHMGLEPRRNINSTSKSEIIQNESNHYQWIASDENEDNSKILKEIKLPLESFHTAHKFYLNRKKKYKIEELYDEWLASASTYNSLSLSDIKAEDIINKAEKC